MQSIGIALRSALTSARTGFYIPLLAAALAAPLRAQDPAGEWSTSTLPLKLALPKLDSLTESLEVGDAKARWIGKLGASAFEMRLMVKGFADDPFAEPEDMAQATMFVVREEWNSETPPVRVTYTPQEPLAGPFGFAGHASLVTGEVATREGGAVQARVWILAGLTQDAGYALILEAEPAPSKEESAVLDAFLRKGVTWSGPVRDPKWTDAEAEARWQKVVPPSSQMKLDKRVRTAHYIVLSNSSGAERYAKKLEERHAATKKQMPFAELPTHRLLPVFYFRTAQETRELVYTNLGISDSEALVDSFADADYLITSADSDDEYEEFADTVEQLWVNRVRAAGGGYWLLSAMKELIAYPGNTRTVTASQLKKGRFTPLATLLDEDRWGKRSDTEMPYSEQCAFFVEYLRATYADKFPLLVHTVGTLPDDDPQWVTESLQSLLGVDLATLEKNWIAWCAKKKK